MTTFSQLVDEIVKELLRPDLREVIATYANQTIREVHFRAGVNTPILFDANRFEEIALVNSDSPWVWTIPSMTRFQDMETVYCPEVGLYLEKKAPRLMQRYSTEPWDAYGWYRTGPAYAFAGLASGMHLNISYFMFPQGVRYLLAENRIVVYDYDTDSYVRVGNPGVPLTDEELAKETNWILQRWEHVVKEGTRAKAWKRMGDDSRTRTSYSAFESIRTSLWNTEPAS